VTVRVDDAGHDGAAADFHDPRSCGNFNLAASPTPRSVAVDDQRCVLPGRRLIDQGGAAQDDHFGRKAAWEATMRSANIAPFSGSLRE